MKYFYFGSDIKKLQICILVKQNCFNKQLLLKNYITPLVKQGINIDSIIIYSLYYSSKNSCTAAEANDYILQLEPLLEKLNITTLLITDSFYFKILTKYKKVAPYYGYVCSIRNYSYKAILSINYQALAYNPDLKKKLNNSLKVLVSWIKGTYHDPGTNIIKYESYPSTFSKIKSTLKSLYKYPELTVDIETKGLEFWNCGLATITFCWNKHQGIAFAIDRGNAPHKIKMLLRGFLTAYSGTLTGHNIMFDFKILIYELWMKHLADYKGMLKGLFILTKNFHDTKLITYLATNNTVQNVLKLKELAAEYTGNYAQEDIKDTTKIPLPQLLRYNLIDGLATWYVKQKYYRKMIKDEQEYLYEHVFKPSVKSLIQTEMCGIPIDPKQVQVAKKRLTVKANAYEKVIRSSQIIKKFHFIQLQNLVNKDNKKLKTKVRTLDDVKDIEFNPNSGAQLRELIYDYLGYEIIDLTKKKQAAVGSDTLEKLKNKAKCKEHKDLFTAFIGLTKVSKILTSFIPAFENAQQLPDRSYRLYGNFNLGGTVSLRISSSKP